MKIRKVSREHHAKVYALLRNAFPGSQYEAKLVQKLHDNGRPLHEWVCIKAGKVIAYVAFSNAYEGDRICGLHLAPMAVTVAMQNMGIGSELLRFALRQKSIAGEPLFVLGEPGYYRRFGFAPCEQPVCRFTKKNKNFMSLRNTSADSFTVGYEPEF